MLMQPQSAQRLHRGSDVKTSLSTRNAISGNFTIDKWSIIQMKSHYAAADPKPSLP
jgi:hypothetical protein